MKISKRKLLIGCAIVVVGLVTLALWQRRDNTSTLVNSEREMPAVTVRTAEAKLGSIQAWIFAEGTVRSARREYLTFENPGRVAFISAGPDGDELREGDPVAAGVLLAHQDQRQYLAEIRTAESSLHEAHTQLAVARAEFEQAKTDETLARTTFQRFEVLVKQNPLHSRNSMRPRPRPPGLGPRSPAPRVKSPRLRPGSKPPSQGWRKPK